AVGDNGKIERSTNYGVSFSTVTPPTVESFFCATWFPAASLFIAGGANGALYTSPTGATGAWASRTSTLGAQRIQAIAVSGTTAVIGGTSGALATSTDGTTWTSRTSGVGGGILGIAYRLTPIGPRYVLITLAHVHWSADAITWNAAASEVQFQADSRTWRAI